MKRAFALLLAVAIVISAAGCSDKYTPPEYNYLDDGSYWYESASGYTNYHINSLPFDSISVEEKYLPLDHVKFWEQYSDHGYFAYIMVAFDRSLFSTDDLHWLTTPNDTLNRTIELHAYAYPASNSSDSDIMDSLGISYNDEYLYFFFGSEKERYSWMDGKVSLQFIVSPTSLIDSDTVYYYYDYEITSANYNDSIECLNEAELKALAIVLKN